MKTTTNFYAIALMAGLVMFISNCTTPTAPKETTTATADDTTAVVSDEKDTTALADTITLATKDTIVKKKLALHIPLTLIINNLTSPTAPVVVGLYGTQNKFPDPKDQLKEYTFKPHGNSLIAKIPNLKFGQYAIALYQDVNSNGKIDKNFIGVPTEPYAFSNNFKPTIKAPGFNNCKFDYDATANTITMNMIK